MTYYFAYGSNMDPARIEERLDRIPDGEPASTPEFRLTFQKPAHGKKMGYANIEPTVEIGPYEVWGVVYDLKDSDLEILDQYEGGYRRETITVWAEERLHDDVDIVDIEAVAYVAVSPDPLVRFPGNRYINRLIDGATHHGIPADYIDGLKRWREKAWFPPSDYPISRGPRVLMGDMSDYSRDH